MRGNISIWGAGPLGHPWLRPSTTVRLNLQIIVLCLMITVTYVSFVAFLVLLLKLNFKNDNVSFISYLNVLFPEILLHKTSVISLHINLSSLTIKEMLMTFLRNLCSFTCLFKYLLFMFTLFNNHSHRRSNVFGDARFWFLPKPNQILPEFYPIYRNFTQICEKKIATPASPAPTPLTTTTVSVPLSMGLIIRSKFLARQTFCLEIYVHNTWKLYFEALLEAFCTAYTPWLECTSPCIASPRNPLTE